MDGDPVLSFGTLDLEIAGVIVEREIEVARVPLLNLADPDADRVAGSMSHFNPLAFSALQDEHGRVLNGKMTEVVASKGRSIGRHFTGRPSVEDCQGLGSVQESIRLGLEMSLR